MLLRRKVFFWQFSKDHPELHVAIRKVLWISRATFFLCSGLIKTKTPKSTEKAFPLLKRKVGRVEIFENLYQKEAKIYGALTRVLTLVLIIMLNSSSGNKTLKFTYARSEQGEIIILVKLKIKLSWESFYRERRWQKTAQNSFSLLLILHLLKLWNLWISFSGNYDIYNETGVTNFSIKLTNSISILLNRKQCE
jgi:hypothetical protein